MPETVIRQSSFIADTAAQNGGALYGGAIVINSTLHSNHANGSGGAMAGYFKLYNDTVVQNQIGMAPGARWIGCRNMNQGSGSPATYLECFEFFGAYPVGGSPSQGDPDLAPDVTNNSWGCPSSEGCTAWDVLKSAVEAHRAAGIMSVVSAGNAGSGCGTWRDPPAIYAAAYSVGAIDSSEDWPSFSSRGPATKSGSPALLKPDIVAPGVAIRSATPSGYGNSSGTSMASPHVAGAVALIWSAHPSLKNDVDATSWLLGSTAKRLPSLVESCGGDYVNGPNNSWGSGLVNVLAAYNGNLVQPAGLVLDDSANDANGVWDTGDTVGVRPTWANHSEVAATAVTGHATTPSPVALTADTASYGDIAAAGSKACTTCFGATATGPRPAGHWDVTLTEMLSTGATKDWVLHVGDSFTDVPESHAFYRHVETVFHHGIPTECQPSAYCPGGTLPRIHTAAFLARTMAGGDANLPASGTVNGTAYGCGSGGSSVFTDVAPESPYCRHVHFLAAQKVTAGCSATSFCPNSLTSRREMAVFLAKGLLGGTGQVPKVYTDPVSARSYSCDPSSPKVQFLDVPAGNAYCPAVHYIWARKITSGCTTTQFCPGSLVTRGQAAVLLVNAFSLNLYEP